MKCVAVLVVAALVSCALATGYDDKKCHLKYQVCCDKKYECGYDTQKYTVQKTCKKPECYDEKVPKTEKKCETKYDQKKVCEPEKKHGYGYRASVRTGYGYGTENCKYVSTPYQHCYDYTTYDVKKVCKDKEYDCSYQDEKKVPKYCSKYECGEYKYKEATGYD